MDIRIALAAIFALAPFVLPAAGEEIGRVELNGAPIILYDDKSWEYAGEPVAAPGDCTAIASEVVPVSLCLDPNRWRRADLDGVEEHAFTHKEHDMYLLLITEKDVIDLPTLRKAVLANARTAAGLSKVDTLEDGSASIDGHEFGRIVYRTTVDGVDATYVNYYTSFEGVGSLQIVAFSGSERFDDVRPAIAEMVAGIRVDRQ